MQSTAEVTMLSAADIDRLPWQPVPDCPGVYAKELWRSVDCVHTLILYEPGAQTPGLPHPHAHQHMWMVAGEATVTGRRLGAGSYLNVPARMPHPINDAGPLGCLLLQVSTAQ